MKSTVQEIRERFDNDVERFSNLETGQHKLINIMLFGQPELEELLALHLDTRVSVQMGGKRGRIGIDFADLADLERIYRRMNNDET